ncbi:MAG: flagellar hook capping FlgD N-terminal domain-containing protein [Sporolactobacillus sp.]
MSTEVSGTQSSTATSGTATTASSTTGTTTLDKDSFLKLLVAQLTHQDPTSPMDTSQFMSQMASFTTLEQTQNMSDAMDKLVSAQSENSLSTEASLIGKQITWTATATDSSGTTTTTSETGIVKAVASKDGNISYVTTSGETVDPSTVTQLQAD